MECGYYDFQVQPREVDLTKRATLIALGDHILHAAGEDADRNGFGIRNLHENNIAWVLSRFAIEVDRLPDEYEKYRIQTWVAEVSRVMTTRNFILRDMEGGEIGRASSQWAIIDMQSRQVLDLRSNVQYTDVVIPLEVPMERPSRIGAVREGTLAEHTVRYSDIDFNQHANSMKYVEWMTDLLPLEKMTSGRLARIDINYIHETRYGEKLTITTEDGDACSRFEVKRQDGTAACRAMIQWNEQ